MTDTTDETNAKDVKVAAGSEVTHVQTPEHAVGSPSTQEKKDTERSDLTPVAEGQRSPSPSNATAPAAAVESEAVKGTTPEPATEPVTVPKPSAEEPEDGEVSDSVRIEHIKIQPS